MKDRLRDIVRHPVTVLSVAVTSASQLFSVPFLDALVAVVWSNIPTLFTASSIGAFTVVPNIPAVPSGVLEALQIAAVLLGIAYGGKLVYGVAKDAQRRFNDNG